LSPSRTLPSPDGSATGPCHYLAWYLSFSLEVHGKKKLRVADHRMFDRDLSGISTSSPASPQMLKEMALRIGADLVLIGSIVQRGSSHFLEITPVQAASGTSLAPLRTSMEATEFLQSLLAPFPANGTQALGAGIAGVGVPSCLHCPAPSFADLARAEKMQGIAVLELVVSPDGQVLQAHSVKLLGYGLDQRA
jgi:hypothetical protein